MEYREEKGVVGRVPEFGAIFMSNISTKKECFRRKLFGLPSAMANFARQVKAGMVLFLFEFERRELFGVFRATSDGATNIVPNAFGSSGRFPAQVRFTPIWFCSPLSEHEFRDAIKENYFSVKKFNFGLSEDQVRRLLCLFSSRKFKKGVPQRQFAREVTIPLGKDRGPIDDDTTNDNVECEPDVGNYPTRPTISKSPVDSLDKVKRVDYDRFSVGHMAESEDKVDFDRGRDGWTDYAGDSWGKRRRIDDDNDDILFMSNVTENDSFDNCALRQTLWNEHNGDSLGEEGIVGDDGRFFTNDRIKIEREIDNIGPVISTDYLENSLNKVRRVGVDSSPLHRVKLAADGGFLMNNISVENERNIGKRGTSESRFFLNGRLENERHVDHRVGPVVSTEQLGDYVGRRTSDTRTFLLNDRAENEIKLDNSFGSVISTDYSRYTLGEDRLIANDGRFRKNDNDIGNFYWPVISTNHTALVYSSKPFGETEYSSPLGRLKEMPVFDQPYHTSHDEIVTRAVPYNPEVPDLFHRQPLPFSPRSYLDRNYRSPSKSKSTPHRSEFESLSRCLDFPPGCGNKVPLPEVLPDFQKINRGSTPIRISNTSSCRDLPFYATSNTLSNTGFIESSLFSDPSLEYIPLPKGETSENEIKRLSGALSSIKDHSLDNGYPVEPRQDCDYKAVGPENNEALACKEFPSPDAGGSRFEDATKPSEARGENGRYQSSGSMRSDDKNDRTSVFARLTLAPRVRVQEQENHTQAVHDKYDTDASVDDIKNLLRQSQNRQIMTRKYKPLVRRHDNDENIRVKDFFAIHDPIKYEKSMIKTVEDEADAEMKIVVNQIIEKSDEPLLEETRLLDFKRRSAIKKNLDETTAKNSVDNAESEALFGKKSADTTEELVGKPLKRRKLVRPDFGKKDPIDESFSDESTLNPISPSHKNRSCENNDTSPNVESVHEVCSTSEGDNDTTAEQNGNSDNCGDGREASNDILNRLSHLLSKVKNRNGGVGSSKEDPMADLTAQDSPVDVYEVKGNHANSVFNEEICP